MEYKKQIDVIRREMIESIIVFLIAIPEIEVEGYTINLHNDEPYIKSGMKWHPIEWALGYTEPFLYLFSTDKLCWLLNKIKEKYTPIITKNVLEIKSGSVV